MKTNSTKKRGNTWSDNLQNRLPDREQQKRIEHALDMAAILNEREVEYTEDVKKEAGQAFTDLTGGYVDLSSGSDGADALIKLQKAILNRRDKWKSINMSNYQKQFSAGYKAALKQMKNTSTFTRSIKSDVDNIVIEYQDDLKDAKADAQKVSEKWVTILWDDTPKGGTKKVDYFFKLPAFDIEYKCTVTVSKKETSEWGGPYGSVEGTVNSKWESDNGWQGVGIGKPDISGEIDTYVGDNYAVEDGATVIQFVIEHLADFFYKTWDDLVESDTKSIRSYKNSIKLDPQDANVKLTNLLNGYLKFLNDTEEMFYKEVYEPTRDDLEAIIDFGIDKGKELMEFMFENNDEFVGNIAKDLELTVRALSNVGNEVNKYLSSNGREDEFEMQKKELAQVFDVQRKIQNVLKQLDYR